ncbi:MAG: putative soluble lytic transglycosylase fused to an ABC-type amino acid-binding protein [Gemmatimonadetes bacterium]|jgi:membrane-bound lytic murein transglycosylase MltF|nr:putative soluble lytic transglycosylase fused to an ABC-type amino acid-binding protein [Gemmatimonadota bacterium]
MRRVSGLLLLLLLPAAPGHAAAQGNALRRAGRALEHAAQERQARRETERFDPIFQKYTKRYFGIGTDWRRFKAQGMAESDLTPGATSRVGARGIMQLMPSTYRHIQSALPQFGRIDDPEWNIAAGILHDRDLWTTWKKDVPDEGERWAFVFAGYNAGEGTIKRARRSAVAAKLDDRSWKSIEQVAPTVGRWRYSETLGYVRTIDANHKRLTSRR